MVAASAPVSASIIKASPYVPSRLSNPSYPTPPATPRWPFSSWFSRELALVRDNRRSTGTCKIHNVISCVLLQKEIHKYRFYIIYIIIKVTYLYKYEIYLSDKKYIKYINVFLIIIFRYFIMWSANLTKIIPSQKFKYYFLFNNNLIN